jgi:dienelactone hydrolase
MSGWSNGAAMALQYALNTPGIAAAAVYSAPDPYRDYKDPCAQIPNPKYFTPILILYNQCDILGICQTGKAFIDDLNNRYGNKIVARVVIVDSFLQSKTTCNLNCNTILGLGLIQHAFWPTSLNDKVFFNFFRQYSSL